MCKLRINREAGENPAQPPLLCLVLWISKMPLVITEKALIQSFCLHHKSGDLPVFKGYLTWAMKCSAVLFVNKVMPWNFIILRFGFVGIIGLYLSLVSRYFFIA